MSIATLASAAALAAAVLLMNAATVPAFAEKRFFTVAAVEPKGGTTVDKEPYPDEPLRAGGGYVKKRPDPTGRWEVSAYMWMPSQIIVNEGDEVTLEFIGINGAFHTAAIVGYVKSFELKRGKTTTVTFKADKPGVFPITCVEHRPSMVGEVIVLSKK